MSEKQYLRGIAKEAPFSKDGEYINFSLNVEQVVELADGPWINLAIRRRRETDMYGNTHSVLVNEYNKDKVAAKAPAPVSTPKNTDPITDAFGGDDDAPF